MTTTDPHEEPLPPGHPGYGWSDVAQARAAGMPPRSDMVGPNDSDEDGEDDSVWILAAVRRTSTRHTDLAEELKRARRSRDEAIRRALRVGISYRRVGEASGLSRPMLDRIRREG